MLESVPAATKQEARIHSGYQSFVEHTHLFMASPIGGKSAFPICLMCGKSLVVMGKTCLLHIEGRPKTIMS